MVDMFKMANIFQTNHRNGTVSNVTDYSFKFTTTSEDFSNSTGETLSDWSTGYFAKYNGYKIFRNDSLKYGEIELR